VIELDNVAYSYGGDDLLHDISLRIQPGSFHFLTGPSGSGKSTFLKLCYMDLTPSSGLVQVFGQDVRGLARDQVALAPCVASKISARQSYRAGSGNVRLWRGR